MEYILTSPFDDEILGMKMAVQLFKIQEYAELYQFFK
jgi:hypothetical protein